MAKILIAEDEKDIRELIVFSLSYAGFEVVAAVDGQDAVEKALEVKLNHAGIEPNRQFEVFVDFEGERVATFYLDLFPNQQVVLEVKAFSHQLTKDELAQVINYLKATGAPVGLLFNFGRRRLEYRRVFPGKDIKPVQRIGRDNTIKK